jgi:hypothetical protein
MLITMIKSTVHCIVHLQCPSSHVHMKVRDSQVLAGVRGQRKHCKHCCEKGISIIYSECVSVALHIQHAMPTCHVICGLPRDTAYFHPILYARGISKKNY